MSKTITKQIGSYTYDEARCLGEGAYGKVYEGIDTRTNEIVAIKKLDLALFQNDRYLQNQIVSEIEIMKKFNHVNIVKFIELISTKKSLYIVTEFCKDGDLKQLLYKKNLQEKEVINIMTQIIIGFKELVKNGVIHRDLKPANILNHNGIVKIADFGFAKYVEQYTSQLLKSCVGSPLYMSPQALGRKPYTTKCDIWSLGVIFYEMLFHTVPWKGRDEDDLLNNMLTKPYKLKSNVQIGAFSENFLKRALVVEEDQRMTWDQVFELASSLNMQTSSLVPKFNHFDDEINEETETVQKVPTWINRALKKPKTIISKDQLNLSLIDQSYARENICLRHFINLELYAYREEIIQENPKDEQRFLEFIAVLSKDIVNQSQDLVQSITDICDAAEQVLDKGEKWNVIKQVKQEVEFMSDLYYELRTYFQQQQLINKIISANILEEYLEEYPNEEMRKAITDFITDSIKFYQEYIRKVSNGEIQASLSHLRCLYFWGELYTIKKLSASYTQLKEYIPDFFQKQQSKEELLKHLQQKIKS